MSSSPAADGRIVAVDALRGLVIALMLVDHAREYFYLHAQVGDPMDLGATPPELFFTRLAAHLCAPVFVALTGLSAWLHGARRDDRSATAAFLFKRGLFLVALELTVVNFAWTFSLTPQVIYLQVIWAIGLSMIALSALCRLPRPLLFALGAAIVLGHNLLDGVAFAEGTAGHAAWAVLHDRGLIDLPFGGQARTSYPVLPWIGVILLGWTAGPWFARGVDAAWRGRRLAVAGGVMLGLFLLLRLANAYGDPTPWSVQASGLTTVMDFLNLTKYPPSADFVLLTLGAGAWLLAAMERAPQGLVRGLAVFGGAPLFFYLLHLYLLHGLNRIGLAVLGPNQGELLSVPGVGALWLLAAAVAVPCWFACRWYVGVKRRARAPWMSYL